MTDEGGVRFITPVGIGLKRAAAGNLADQDRMGLENASSQLDDVSSRSGYWMAKVNRNSQRDIENSNEPVRQGLKVVRFWEHEFKEKPKKCFIALKKALSLEAK